MQVLSGDKPLTLWQRVRHLLGLMDEEHGVATWWQEPKKEDKYLASLTEGKMIKVISKYQFLLRIDDDGNRVVAHRGQAVNVTAEEFKRMRHKFIPYEEVVTKQSHANNKQEQTQTTARPEPGNSVADKGPQGYR